MKYDHNLLKYRPLWAARVRTVHYNTPWACVPSSQRASPAALPRAGRRGATRRGFPFLRNAAAANRSVQQIAFIAIILDIVAGGQTIRCERMINAQVE